MRPLVELLGGGIRFLLSLLILIATLIVAMACTNVIERRTGTSARRRRRELSLRTAIGAGRWDHVKQIMAEGFVLSAARASSAWRSAHGDLPALKWLGGPQARVLTDATINGRILAAGVITAFLMPIRDFASAGDCAAGDPMRTTCARRACDTRTRPSHADGARRTAGRARRRVAGAGRVAWTDGVDDARASNLVWTRHRC